MNRSVKLTWRQVEEMHSDDATAQARGETGGLAARGRTGGSGGGGRRLIHFGPQRNDLRGQ